MDILKTLNDYWAVIMFAISVGWAQIANYFMVKETIQDVRELKKAHAENRKLIEDIIGMKKDIEYIKDMVRQNNKRPE